MAFCGGCGASLVTRSTQSVPAERRQVAVLFVDLVGFTNLTSELGAETMQTILDAFFAAVDGIVVRCGGSVDKHIGDCVMALFGAPIARGDDVARAARAAVAIVAAMPGISGRVGRELQAHGGIAVGDVVASDAARHGYTVTGETVNLAARLADLATAGEILVSDTVRLVLGGVIRLEPRGEVALQGFAKAQPVHRLLELAETAGLDAGPLIGREAELDQLIGFLARVGASGAGSLVVLRGDAGVGKTRLVRELEQRAPQHGFAAHVGPGSRLRGGRGA